MNLSIRFPNISAYFEGMNKSFTVFGFEITVYGILVAVGMLLGLAVIMLQVRKHKENPNLYQRKAMDRTHQYPWGRTCNIWRDLRRRAGRIYLL